MPDDLFVRHFLFMVVVMLDNFKKIGTKLFKIGNNVTKDFVMLLKIN